MFGIIEFEEIDIEVIVFLFGVKVKYRYFEFCEVCIVG